MSKQLYKLSLHHNDFPPVEDALDDPDGLLAVGGDLSVTRLHSAYQQGIFPWFSQGDPILWWSPSVRATVKPNAIHISKSMARFIRNTDLKVTINKSFASVIEACSQPRIDQPGTWIVDSIKSAYIALHEAGFAHSIEVWQQDKLVGGLYGVNIGGVFCGESMFHLVSNASKLAFIKLAEHFLRCGGKLIDCQMMTGHLQSLGVSAQPRHLFLKQLQLVKDVKLEKSCWQSQLID